MMGKIFQQIKSIFTGSTVEEQEKIEIENTLNWDKIRLTTFSKEEEKKRIQKIQEYFKYLLEKESKKAWEHKQDPYWNDGYGNVGDDEMRAVINIRKIDINPEKFDTARSFISYIIGELRRMKETDNSEDYTGYGSSTYSTLIFRLIEYCEEAEIYISNVEEMIRINS